jgi:hypothetical protein
MESEIHRLLREAGDRGPLPYRATDEANHQYFATYADLVNYHWRIFSARPSLSYIGTDHVVVVQPPLVLSLLKSLLS